FFVFFFSSRRRHTRWPRDWSSDVCSSDLERHAVQPAVAGTHGLEGSRLLDRRLEALLVVLKVEGIGGAEPAVEFVPGAIIYEERSEERRVGKEWRSGGGAGRLK